MSIGDYTLADLAAATGNNDGFGEGGNGGWWILLLFILLGGWNGNRGWGGNGGGAGSVGGDALYPWMENSQAISNGFAAAEAAAAARQAASTQQSFALQQQFADCCCENRLGIANLGADIAREACADRAAVSDGIRDVLVNQDANTQRILDMMCQDKIDAKNERIAELQTQLNIANLSASQTAQTAQLLADNARQTTALEQYLNPAPIPAYMVQNPNCCTQNYGCGCGCN